ncbi:MAG: hypothetical protein DMG39_26695 [Acidobacteria bacterium]|nr:MAG: hypothetical protein DMG39_26695 [Acidobacteriota bacterium]
MFADRTNWNLAPNRLSEALARHRAAEKPLIDLTVSNPTECGFAYEGRTILEALRNPEALKYQPAPRGLVSARQAVCEYYAEHHAAVGVDDIILTTSTSEAYSFVFRLLCNPGDEILIPAPSYPLFDFLADIQDVKLVPGRSSFMCWSKRLHHARARSLWYTPIIPPVISRSAPKWRN